VATEGETAAADGEEDVSIVPKISTDVIDFLWEKRTGDRGCKTATDGSQCGLRGWLALAKMVMMV
jgi:hypothetical protein